MKTKTMKMEFPADIKFLKPVHEVVANVASIVGFDDRAKMHVLVAASEMVTNAIVYGNQSDLSKKVCLCFELTDEKMVFKVKDQGAGFDFEFIREKEKNLDADDVHGRGIFLIETYMDEVYYTKTDDGFEVQAVKYKDEERKDKGVMNIEVRTENNISILDAEGKIDATSNQILKDKIKELVAEGQHNIVLNMEKVPFVNSTGLGTLVGILKELRGLKGTVKLIHLQPYVQELFEVTQLVKVFEIFDDEGLAVKSFS